MAQLSVRVTEVPKKIVACGDGVEMLETLLAKADLNGVWSVRPLQQIRWKSDERFRIIRFDGAQNRILVKLRPGAADTAWEWQLSPPSITGAGTAYTKLLAVDGWDGFLTEAERNVRDGERHARRNGHASREEKPEDEPKVNIVDRLAALQKDADRWINRAETIIANEAQLAERMESLAAAENDLNELRKLHERDEDGKRAYAALQQLQRMLA